MTTMTRRTMLALLTACATSAAVPQLAQAAQSTARTSYSPALPEPTGPYRIGTTELHLVDKTRQDPWVPGRVRELMISIWYPALSVLGGPRAPYAPVHAAGPLADQIGAVLELKPGSIDLAGTTTHARIAAPALGRHPVLLYSPGMGTSRLMGTNHVEELASRGYVVVAMDHTGEAPVEFPRGRVVPLTMPTSEDVIKPATAVRVADTRFVLDTIARLAAGVNPDAERRPLPIGLATALDLRRTGMFGYSLGGFTTGETMLVDRRVAVGANLDGTLQYGHPTLELSDVAKSGLDRPFLLFASEHHTHLPQPGSPYEDRSWISFWNHQRGWKLDLRFPEGTHGAFADYQFMIPAIAKVYGVPQAVVEELLGKVDPERSVAAQRAYLGAYFDEFLKGRTQPLLRRESPRFPDVEFVR
jgi:predicted dienelactone hydrolase